MTKTTDPKSFRLSGPSLDAARRLADIRDQRQAFQDQLQQEFQDRAETASAGFKADMDEQFDIIARDLGLEAENLTQWYLEVTYLEHGVVFLTKQPEKSQANPSDVTFFRDFLARSIN